MEIEKVLANVPKTISSKWLLNFLGVLKSTERTWILLLFQKDLFKCESTLSNLMQRLLKYGSLNKLNGSDGLITADDEYFKQASEKAHSAILALSGIAKSLFAVSTDVTDDSISKAVISSQRHVVLSSFELCSQHLNRDDPWVSQSSSVAANNLLKTLQDLLTSRTVGDLLSKSSAPVFPARAPILYVVEALKPNLGPSTWRLHPGAMASMLWCVQNTVFPFMSDRIDDFLPAMLLLVDDHSLECQLKGVRAIHHLLENTSSTEITWNGRADVIYNAIQRLTYGAELKLLESLLPCLLLTLSRLETPPGRHIGNVTWSKHDDIIDRLLEDLVLETSVEKKTCLLRHLGRYVTAIGIHTIKHYARIWPLLDIILSENENHKTLQSAILFSKHVVEASKPRGAKHVPRLLNNLLKLCIRLKDLDDAIAGETKEKITEVIDCLIMVHSEETKEVLDKVCQISGIDLKLFIIEKHMNKIQL